MNTRRALLALGLAALVWTGPVALHGADAAVKPADGKAGPAAVSDSVHPGSTIQTSNYVLRPTDVLTIKVVDDDRATEDVAINADGTVQLTYLDADKPLQLNGRTVDEAKKLIVRAYVDQKIFVKPTITVTVKTYSARRINVFGAVNSPGPVDIPPEEDFTLVSAISAAHGPTSRAAETVTITRKMPDGSTKTFTADLLKAMHGTVKDPPLEEGDTITVGESMIANVYQ